MTNAAVLKVLVLAHDLTNVNVHRRIEMLREGGALVTVAGFRRAPHAVPEVEGCVATDFGRTHNGRFLQRIFSVLREVLLLKRHRTLFSDVDVIIARNMEMLAIAVRGRSFCQPKPVLIYECIDIHRLLLRRDIIGWAMRNLEGWLAKRASALFTSSLAFVSGYFEPLSQVRLPVRLLENKVLDVKQNALLSVTREHRKLGPPWVIGWFGMIRCKKSLQILAELARQNAGKIEIVIRGRPTPDQFDNFEDIIAALPGVRFKGPYKPADLEAMYREVHFSWAIDMFEEGLNSTWLLPNRLYEGGTYDCVPIADKDLETGYYLERLGIGVTIKQPLGTALAAFFRELTAEKYRALEDAATKVPRSVWIDDANDCIALVDYIRSLKGASHA